MPRQRPKRSPIEGCIRTARRVRIGPAGTSEGEEVPDIIRDVCREASDLAVKVLPSHATSSAMSDVMQAGLLHFGCPAIGFKKRLNVPLSRLFVRLLIGQHYAVPVPRTLDHAA